MAGYSDNPGSGGDDNYSDAAAPESTADESTKDKSDLDESPRGLLPKSILAGKDFKPGDEIVLKIDAIHDDEVEVSYATAKGPEGEGGEKQEMAGQGEASAGGGDAEMRSMME